MSEIKTLNEIEKEINRFATAIRHANERVLGKQSKKRENGLPPLPSIPPASPWNRYDNWLFPKDPPGTISVTPEEHEAKKRSVIVSWESEMRGLVKDSLSGDPHRRAAANGLSISYDRAGKEGRTFIDGLGWRQPENVRPHDGRIAELFEIIFKKGDPSVDEVNLPKQKHLSQPRKRAGMREASAQKKETKKQANAKMKQMFNFFLSLKRREDVTKRCSRSF